MPMLSVSQDHPAWLLFCIRQQFGDIRNIELPIAIHKEEPLPLRCIKTTDQGGSIASIRSVM
jgi:hypothetical protein